jgi:hypothetical protein
MQRLRRRSMGGSLASSYREPLTGDVGYPHAQAQAETVWLIVRPGFTSSPAKHLSASRLSLSAAACATDRFIEWLSLRISI